jgi:hypothetical protein
MQFEDCPLRSLLSDQRIAAILKNRGSILGEYDDSVDTLVVTFWAILWNTDKAPYWQRAWELPCCAASS